MKLDSKAQQTHIYFIILFLFKTLISKIQIYAFQNSNFGVHALRISNLHN